MKYCALCCTACDEDRFLGEWLAYHALLGFEHFIVYDDCSAKPISELLGAWLRPGQVTVVRHASKRDQLATYTQCLADFGSMFKWIAFLDVDEFIRLGPVLRAPPGGSAGTPGTAGAGARAPGRALYSDIRVFLSAFEPYAGVGLNWRMFSSSGHAARPPGPVVGSYDRCLGDDIHIKSVVQPPRIKSVAGPHSFVPKDGWTVVTPSRFPVPPGFAFAVPQTAQAAVNHYFYKSRECFSEKVARGNPCRIVHRMEEFDRHLTLPATADYSLEARADAVSAALKAERMPLVEAPVHLSGEQLGDLPATGLGNARAWLNAAGRGKAGTPGIAAAHPAPAAPAAAVDADSANALRQALLHLAYVSLCNDADGKPDPHIELEVWTLRAEAAMLDGQADLALFCLERAMALGAGKEAYALYARWLLEQGDREASRHALKILGAHGAKG